MCCCCCCCCCWRIGRWTRKQESLVHKPFRQSQVSIPTDAAKCFVVCCAQVVFCELKGCNEPLHKIGTVGSACSTEFAVVICTRVWHSMRKVCCEPLRYFQMALRKHIFKHRGDIICVEIQRPAAAVNLQNVLCKPCQNCSSALVTHVTNKGISVAKVHASQVELVHKPPRVIQTPCCAGACKCLP